ncbi:unnamed protein product, partial [Aphis gossypii]
MTIACACSDDCVAREVTRTYVSLGACVRARVCVCECNRGQTTTAIEARTTDGTKQNNNNNKDDCCVSRARVVFSSSSSDRGEKNTIEYTHTHTQTTFYYYYYYYYYEPLWYDELAVTTNGKSQIRSRGGRAIIIITSYRRRRGPGSGGMEFFEFDNISIILLLLLLYFVRGMSARDTD